MIEETELQDSDKFQYFTINGDGGIGDVAEFSGEKLQILTLAEAQAKGWGLDIQCETEEEHFIPSPVVANPPIIEEENSSDNLPALGHLEGFEIQTADDGTLLPSTVNAKMADGSYQRLTLFPQLVDGNITCIVQFENEVAQLQETPEPLQLYQGLSLPDKIDRIIHQNEDTIANTSLLRPVKKAREAPVSLIKPSKLRQATTPRPRKITSLRGPMSQSALYYPIKETFEASEQYLKLKEKLDRFSSNKRLQNLSRMTNSTMPTSSVMEQRMPRAVPIVRERQANGKVRFKAPVPPSEVKSEEVEDIFIKTSPEFFPAKENKSDQPLGSTENPITLLQAGKVYHSKQPLSETQLRQISSILKTQLKNPPVSVDKNYLIDPKTKTKIVYRVVYPDDDKPEEPKPKRGAKRGRAKAPVKELSDLQNDEGKVKDELKDEDATADVHPSAKIMKMPRTRCGRLTRPPRYMVQDYKRLQTNGDVPAKAVEADLYVDYHKPEEEVTPPINNSLFLPSQRKRKKNFKSEYRCPTCQKIYLGHDKMMSHLRKFPDHSNMDEYLEIYERARTDRKVRPLNVSKLKQMLSGTDKASYGPLLANAFTLWDFLLLRVSLLHQTGVEEVEALLKELFVMLEKLGKIAEELLSPAFEHEDAPNANYIHLDKHEVAYAMGLPPGTYKVNIDRLHLLRLSKDEPAPLPPPPPPTLPPPVSRPSQLATKFEPNLSTKLLDCSNDSIDLDCSSKDVEPEDDKKEWNTVNKVDDTNSEFLSEFLQNQLPNGSGEGLTLWKATNEMAHVSPARGLPAPADSGLSLWKGGKQVEPEREDIQIWKDTSDSSWKSGENANSGDGLWKEADPSTRNTSMAGWAERDGGWKDSTDARSSNPNLHSKDERWKDKSKDQSVSWQKTQKPNETWEGGEKESKKDWLRQWKEETGVPGLRSARLTSTPETHGPAALFSPPLRRNSVSSFAPSHQEELLSLELHELFEELMPEHGKPRRPKPGSIESIINEALFTGNAPPASHASLPPSLIPDALDEVTNLDFLSQD